MRVLLIFPLLIFASVSATLDCKNLVGEFTLDEVSHCSELIAPEEGPKLILKGVDDTKWKKWAAQLKIVDLVHIYIEESRITKIDLSNIADFLWSHLAVKNNSLLQSVNIAIKNSEFYGLLISDNPKLETFTLTGDGFETGRIEFINNKVLKKAKIPKLSWKESSGIQGFYIEGNPHLDKASLQMFKEVASSAKDKTYSRYVQEEGECIFKKDITDLGELVGCKYVKGDLTLAKDVKGDGKETKLTEVTGDVHLGNLPKDKAGFLEGTKLTKGEEAIKSDNCVKLNTVPKPKYRNQKDCDEKQKAAEEQKAPDEQKEKKEGDKGLSIWIIIGIAAGVLLLVLIIVGVLLYCLCFKKKKAGGGKAKTGTGATGTTATGGGKNEIKDA